MSLTIGLFDKAVYMEAELSNLETQEYARRFSQVVPVVEREIDRSEKVGIYRGGKCIGGAYIDTDNHFHIAVLPEHQGAWAFVFLRVLDWAWSIAHPFVAVVSVNNSKVKALFRFVDARLVRLTEFVEIYEISRRK